ncbi:MAG: hypothetical protein HZB67_04490 [Candidatus Aenigmarchaeota archaeon]|nr:hypothetical protein [Candidatus Aenigmarchaeota archaeon]
MYNFASIQPTEKLAIECSKEATTKLYFYNIYGNNATKIKLIAESDLIVEIEPENLTIKPTRPLKEKPANISDDTEYLTIPSIDGFVETKFATIKITVPKEMKVGKHNLTITATAEWFAQPTNIIQKRDFDYEVDVVDGKATVSDASIAIVILFILLILLVIVVFLKSEHSTPAS